MKLVFFSGIAFLFILFTSCSQLPGSQPLVHIGDTVHNGIVFYVDNSRQHGMVCSLADLGTAPWDTTLFDAQYYYLYNPPFVSGTDTAFGSGNANTTLIENRIGNGYYAASLCRSSTTDSYGNWSLPSKSELGLLYTNLKLSGLATFANTNTACPDCGVYYWSSSEIDNKAVWSRRFDTGDEVNTAWKNNAMFVRAVRAF